MSPFCGPELRGRELYAIQRPFYQPYPCRISLKSPHCSCSLTRCA